MARHLVRSAATLRAIQPDLSGVHSKGFIPGLAPEPCADGLQTPGGVPGIGALSLMPVTAQWLPVENGGEQQFAERLVREERGFNKALRFNIGADPTGVCATRVDMCEQAVALRVEPPDDDIGSTTFQDGVGAAGHRAWNWHVDDADRAALPSRLGTTGLDVLLAQGQDLQAGQGLWVCSNKAKSWRTALASPFCVMTRGSRSAASRVSTSAALALRQLMGLTCEEQRTTKPSGTGLNMVSCESPSSSSLGGSKRPSVCQAPAKRRQGGRQCNGGALCPPAAGDREQRCRTAAAAPPDAFAAGTRARHARKTSFRAQVNGSRRNRHDADDEV